MNGVTAIALTKLDTLGGFDPVKICKQYKAGGEVITEQPASVHTYSECEPVYEELDGWPDLSENEWNNIAKEGYDALPKQTKEYIEKLESIMKAKVKVISIGQAREATINRVNVWA